MAFWIPLASGRSDLREGRWRGRMYPPGLLIRATCRSACPSGAWWVWPAIRPCALVGAGAVAVADILRRSPRRRRRGRLV